MFTKQAADHLQSLYHATTKDSLDRILSSGKIKALKHVAKESPDLELSVELSPVPVRVNMPASGAVEHLKKYKDTDNIFFTRGGVLPNYGNYVIAKTLHNTKPSTLFNSIPNEFVTPKAVSVKRKTKIFVPDEELADWVKKYPNLSKRFVAKSEFAAPSYGFTDRAKAIYSKLTKTSAHVIPVKSLGRNAIIGGSTGLGIDADGSDVDMFIPYKRRAAYENAIKRITTKYPSLTQRSSTLNNEFKTTLTGDVNGKEVDVVLGFGDKANAYHKAYLDAKSKLTYQDRINIVNRKRALKNAWFFPGTRYKMYKNQLATDLGLKEHYF